MKNYNDRLALGYFDHNGKMHKVEYLNKIPTINGIISDELRDPIPEYIEPAEFSMKVEFSEEFFEELKIQMRKIDEMIIVEYDNIIKALEHCDEELPECKNCPFISKPNCKSKLRNYVLTIVKTQRRLIAEAIEKKWTDGWLKEEETNDTSTSV